jgi:hypothetical protein
MKPYITGLCGIGCHEGDAPKNILGHALPTCMNLDSCNCSCHVLYTTMFHEVDRPRTPVDNSGYVPDRGRFVMPDLDELAKERMLSSLNGSNPPEIIESRAPDRIPSTMKRTFAPTSSGVSAKGELEAKVLEVCNDWALLQPSFKCLPAYISDTIQVIHNCKPPSVGAIGAVFDRWVAIGFADCRRKPVRFEGFTEQGVKLGLEGCKEKARLLKKQGR